MEDLRYPIGKFQRPTEVTSGDRREHLQNIGALPALILQAVEGLTDEQLDTPYREGGWTVRQVIHHLADSHMNAYVRTKLAMTENEPTIKPYDEARWAALDDASKAPIDVSLVLLTALHDRWVRALHSLQDEDFARTFRHPERGTMSIDEQVALYDWHGRHHLAHITGLRDRMDWR